MATQIRNRERQAAARTTWGIARGWECRAGGDEEEEEVEAALAGREEIKYFIRLINGVLTRA